MIGSCRSDASCIGGTNETNFDLSRSRWSTRVGGVLSGCRISGP